MGFTGRLGTEESQLGSIVLGIVDSFGLVPIQCKIYPDSPKSFLAVFERPVTDSALLPSRYAVTPTSTIAGRFQKVEIGKAYNSTTTFYVGQTGTFTSGANAGVDFVVSSVQDGVITFSGSVIDDLNFVSFETELPFPVSVEFTDTQHRTVRVTFATNFVAGPYNVTISGVGDFEGRVVEPIPRPFTIITSRTIFATSARFSVNKSIDVIFDQAVNPYTTTGGWSLVNESGFSQSLTPISWGPTGLPANVVRLSTSSVPGGFSSKQLFVNYSSVKDSSGNNNDGLVPVVLETKSSGTTFADVTLLQATDGFILDRWVDHKMTVVRVYLNAACTNATVSNSSNWTVTAYCGHTGPDSSNAITAPAATSTIGQLTTLVLDMEAKIYQHFRNSSIHHSAPSLRVTPPGGYSGLVDTLTHLNSLAIAYNSHLKSESHHSNADLIGVVEPSLAQDLASAIVLANSIRSSYIAHRSNSRNVGFKTTPNATIFPVNNHASSNTYIQNSFGPSYFVDLYMDGLLDPQPIQVQCSISPEGGGTPTNPDTTGKVSISTAKSGFFQDEKSGAEFWSRGSGSAEIQDLRSAGVPLAFRSEEQYTNDMFVYLINKLYLSYNMHLTTDFGAQHLAVDTNAVPDEMFPLSWDPIRVQNNIDRFYGEFLHAHTQNIQFHTDIVGYPQPRDVFDVYQEFRIHNTSGQNSQRGTFGAHIKSGFDGGSLPSPNMRSLTIDQPRTGSALVANGNETRGYSYPASARSVIQSPGVLYNIESVSIRTDDTLILNFSEPLKQTAIQPTDFQCPSTGNIKVLDAQWVDERTISLRVRGLSNSTGAVFASNLVSKSGESL